MDISEQRQRRDIQPQPFHDRSRLPADRALLPPPATPPTHPPEPRLDPADLPGYTLMVAGRRTGKTAFLRLLLDTSVVSPTAPQDQLAAVAKFVQGAGGPTQHIRSVSVNVDLALGLGLDTTDLQTLVLSLVDTPALDFDDPAAAQRTVDEIMRHVDTRFSESVQDDRKAYAGNHHVHLCIYFLDPDTIVPPSTVSVAPAPMVPPRARTNSLSAKAELAEPVILEPPVTTNPLLCRPTLPQADIATIRRLSARVNVLPVIGRADLLTNDRLTSVKIAVRRDLASAGIGFGIFDNTPPHLVFGPDAGIVVTKVDHQTNGYAHANGGGAVAAAVLPRPSPPISSTPLPYALISPDAYSHSDGVTRPVPSRHEIILQYTPSYHSVSSQHAASKIAPGKWVRNYRWGNLDCMDADHCEFLHLRGAIFHHMKTLQKYTREFLLERFKADYMSQNPLPQPPPPTLTRSQRSPANSRGPPAMAHGSSRPILAIDTAADHFSGGGTRRPSLSVARSAVNGDSGDGQAQPQPQQHPQQQPQHQLPGQATIIPDLSPKTASSTRSQRTRTKKITVACNFCRSRKLKCDGGRPACSQCFKRSNPCDYMAGHKRRGSGKRRKADDGSESDGDAEGESAEPSGSAGDDPSQSPEATPMTHSRRSSNTNAENVPASMGDRDRDVKLPPLNGTIAAFERERERERAEEMNGHGQQQSTKLPPIMQSSALLHGPHTHAPPHAHSHAHAHPPHAHPPSVQQPVSVEQRTYVKHELPPIATLPPITSSPDFGQTLPPLRAPGEMQGVPSSGSAQGHGQGGGQRRRTSSAASTKGRQNGYSSKIVACNFCRARKTRCDGVHPSCGSCARRALPCNYVNDREGNNPKGRPKGNATAGPSAAPPSRVSPSPAQAQTMPLTGSYNGYARENEQQQDLKRNLDGDVAGLPNKKPRVMDELQSIVAMTQVA